MSKKIIILGSGAGWEDCLFDDETWVIGKLLLNPQFINNKKARADKVFNMDNVPDMMVFNEKSGHKAPYTINQFIDAMNKNDKEFITSYNYPRIKNCVQFPIRDISEKFGVMYYTNTICYMIAYALYLGVEEITFYGVNQVGAIEYLNERKGVEFWMGLAAGMGTRIEIKGRSPLLHNDKMMLYGYKKSELEIEKEFKIWEN